jgi:hypothetical protein
MQLSMPTGVGRGVKGDMAQYRISVVVIRSSQWKNPVIRLSQ